MPFDFIWIAFPLLFILVLLKVPIAFAMGLISFFALLEGGYSLTSLPIMLGDSLQSFALLAIPLFVLVGELLSRGGTAHRLIDAASSWVGSFTGGLGHVNIVTSMLFANISGSSNADAASVGSVLIPEMVKRGYPRDSSVMITSASASIGIIIPPSIAMIIYAFASGLSVARMFLSGFIPGIIYGLSLMGLVYFQAKKQEWPCYEPFSWSNVKEKTWKALPASLIPIVIFGGIFTGAFTVTESAAIAVVVALIVSVFIYKELSIKEIPGSIRSSLKITSAVLMVIATSHVFAWYLTVERIPVYLAETMVGITESEPLLLLIMMFVIIISGIIIHANPMIMIYTPIFLPLVREMGMDPYHFGIIFIIAICVGQQTPPVASVLLTTCKVGNLPVEKIFRVIWPFYFVLIFVLLLIAFVPPITTFLPNLLLGAI